MENVSDKMCPACGAKVYPYGFSWACSEPYCDNSQYHAFVGRKETPEWWGKVKVYLDGSEWCATYPNFTNLQESPAGFGKTPHEAVMNLTPLN